MIINMDKLAIFGGKPIRSTVLPLADPEIGDEEIAQVVEVLKSKWISQGEKVEEFETKFSEYIGTEYAVAVSSGTAALHTAFIACGVKKGDEVIVPSFTHISTANAALYCGAHPIFVEINPDTYTIDPNDVEDKISRQTKAIVPVHWAGHPADMNALIKIAEAKDLILIEDACQAAGAIYHSKKVGNFGLAACFSMYPSKIITTGEGGMVTTNNRNICEKLKMLRNYGQTPGKRFHHTMLGYNYRITELQAALGIAQLGKIEEKIRRKSENAYKLSKQLQKVAGFNPPSIQNDIRHIFMHYMVKVDEKKFGKSRDFVIDALNAENIQSRLYIPPIHLQPYYREKFGFEEGDLPVTEDVVKKVLTLPCLTTMGDTDIKDIVRAIQKIKESKI